MRAGFRRSVAINWGQDPWSGREIVQHVSPMSFEKVLQLGP